MTRTDTNGDLVELFSERGELPGGIPGELQRFLSGQNGSEWVPLVVSHAALLLARDVVFASDEALVNWARENMRRLIDRPAYRALLRFMSSTLIAMGAAKRWEAFHRGTKLEADPVVKNGARVSTNLRLAFPARSFTTLILRQLVGGMKVVLEVGRVPDGRIDLVEETETGAIINSSWCA